MQPLFLLHREFFQILTEKEICGDKYENYKNKNGTY